MPTHQQDNGHDCGLFAIATMVTLANGLDPSKVVYKPNMRAQLLEMFKTQSIKMFDYEERDDNGPNRSRFTVPSGGRLKKSTLLTTPMPTTFDTICYCQLPRTWDNVIICDICHSENHQRCCLIGQPVKGHGIAQSLPSFVCLNCRSSGQYSIGFSANISPDYEAIDVVSSKIESLENTNLGELYDIIINHRKPIPSKLTDYRLIESVYQKYDLNAVCEERGPIYVAMRNFWTNHSRDMEEPTDFTDINQGQKVYLALKLICIVQDMELPPIHFTPQDVVCGQNLSKVVKENKTWLPTLYLHCEHLHAQKEKQIVQGTVRGREW